MQLQQNQVGGFFATASGVDVYRYPGFITPGPKPVLAAHAVSQTGNINAIGALDTLYAGFAGATGDQLYGITASGDIVVTGIFPHTVGNTLDYGVITYPINHINYMFYFFGNDIGRWDLGLTFVDNWGSTIPTGAGALSVGGKHIPVIFNGLLYFTNGSMIASLDGTQGTNGILNRTAGSPNVLILPDNYTAMDIKIINGNLEIYANGPGIPKIYTWDGVSPLPNAEASVDDNLIGSGLSLEGFPHLFTSGKDNGFTIRKKNFYGYQPVQLVRNSTNPPAAYQTDTINGMVCFTTTAADSLIYTYGTPFQNYSYRGNDNTGNFPEALHAPFKVSQAGKTIRAIRVIANKLIVSYDSRTETFDITDYTSWNNANATFQTNFIQLPNDSIMDYVRFYILPPAANTAFTPTLFTDFSNSGVPLPDITPATLDANGKSKTYYADQLGAPICDNFALAGAWNNSSSNTDTIVITRIDVGYTVQ